MIVINSGQVLGAKVGTASAVYATAILDQVSTADSFLNQQALIGTSATTIYTASGGPALVKELILANGTASDVTSCAIFVAGSQATGLFTIPANGTAILADGRLNCYDSLGKPVSQSAVTVTNSDGTVTVSPSSPYTLSRPAITGDISIPTASNVATLPTVNSNVGTFGGDGRHALQATVDGKGRTTAISAAPILVPTGWIDVTLQATPVLPGNSAATNVTNLNTILTNAPGGSVIFFPGGQYTFNAGITVPAKALFFRGSVGGYTGGYTILMWTANVAGDLFALTSGNWYSNFQDLMFSTTVNQTAGAAVAINNNVGCHMKNIVFGNGGGTFYNCISFIGASSGQNTILDTIVAGGSWTNHMFYVNGANSQPVIINSVGNGQWGTSTQTAASCVCVTIAGALQIDNCDFIGATNNMLVNPSTSQVVGSIFASNTYFDNANGSSLKITGAGTTVRCKFVSCWFTTSSATTGLSGIEVSSSVSGGSLGLDFENCTILNTFGTTGTTNGFLITGAADFTILGCRIAGWTNGINITPASPAGTTRPVIVGNTLGNAGGYGVNTVGILLNTGSALYGNLIITDNNLAGCTTPITDLTQVAGQKQIASNLGLSNQPPPLLATSATFTTTETILHQIAFPANALMVGTTIRLTALISATGGTAPTLLGRLRIGTAGTVADAAASATAAVTIAGTNSYLVSALFTVRSIGATGSIMSVASVGATNATAPAAVTVATTSALIATLTATGGGTASATLSTLMAFSEVVRQ